MLISLDNRTVETHGVQASQRASIAMGAKFVRVFASQIYSDKPLAIIGELLANAWDSHRLAGKEDVPIQLKLPTSFDRKLRIYDSGVGMTHEFMMTRFNCFLDSTKDNENISAGGYGIGSKTPAAYTDSYTIRCRQNGTARTYIEYKDTDGVLNLAYIGEEITDEPNGVDVTLEIKLEDINRFVAAARFAVPFVAEPHVEVFGAEFTGTPWQHQSDEFSLYRPHFFPGNYQASHLAVIGPRAYKLDLYAHGINCPEGLRHLIGVAFHFGIGEVEVTPSREALSLTKETIEAINRKIVKFIGLYAVMLEQGLNAYSDFIPAFRFWRERINEYYTRQMLGTLATNILWRGVDFNAPINLQAPGRRFISGRRKISWGPHDEISDPSCTWLLQHDSSQPPCIMVMDSPTAWRARIRSVVKAASRPQTIFLVRSIKDAETLLGAMHLPLEQYELLSKASAPYRKLTTKQAVIERRPVPVLAYLPGTDHWAEVDNVWELMQNRPDCTFYAVGLRRGKFPEQHDRHDYLLKYNSELLPNTIVLGVQQSHGALLTRLKLPDFTAYIKAKQAALEQLPGYERTMMHLHYQLRVPLEMKTYGRLLQKNKYLSEETRQHLGKVINEMYRWEKIEQVGQLSTFHIYTKELLDLTISTPAKTDYVLSWEWLTTTFPLFYHLLDAAPYYYSEETASHYTHIVAKYMTTQEAFYDCLHQD